MKRPYIGHALVFDSGVGGLSVAEEIRNRLPDLKMTYVADDVFRPYGEKTEAQLQERLPRLLWELTEMMSPDIIVIACNTASTTALSHIRAVIDIPLVGVVPAIKPAAQISKTKTIAVLGTPGTVRRKYVGGLIKDFASDCQVILKGSVELVEMAEKKLSGKAVDLNRLRAEIAPMFEGPQGADIDAVVLACTHFPLLRDQLKSCVTQSVQWIDSGHAIAARVEELLSVNPPKPALPRGEDMAFLMGPPTYPARVQAFNAYGFSRVIGLMPG